MENKIALLFNVNVEQIFCFSKGRVAFYALLKAMGIGPGDEVLMSGYTCVMVPSAPMFLGATCRYLDIEPHTYNLNPRLLDSHYSNKTKALIIQHTYGIAQDMAPILQWAKEKNIPIIEDCCHVFGSTYKNQLCGTFGVGAFFSGQWNKPFSTGLGGILLVNEASLLPKVQAIYESAVLPTLVEELRLKIQILSYKGLVNPKTVGAVMMAYRILSRLGIAAGSSSNEEFSGAMPKGYLKRMASVQKQEGERTLVSISALLAHRKQLGEYYAEKLPKIGFMSHMPMSESENIILRYPVRVANKEAIVSKALRNGVEIGSWFEIPLHPKGIDMACFGYQPGMCPESEKACCEVINLPTHQKISLKEADRILAFLQKYGKAVSPGTSIGSVPEES